MLRYWKTWSSSSREIVNDPNSVRLGSGEGGGGQGTAVVW